MVSCDHKINLQTGHRHEANASNTEYEGKDFPFNATNPKSDWWENNLVHIRQPQALNKEK